MNINSLFYQLIRIAIGNADSLSHTPSPKEWNAVYQIVKKHSLIGICFAALQRLGADADEGHTRIGMSEMLYFNWIGMAATIQKKNDIINQQCVKLQMMLSSAGYKSCILKGQSVANLYKSTGPTQNSSDLSGLRQSGDIDMWMVADPKTVIEWARVTGKMYYYDYHHADLSLFDDTEVELHYRPSLSRNLIRNSRLQKWFKKEGAKHIIYNDKLGFSVPDYIFNVLLTMNHNFWHLLYEGVGMRQFIDLYFVLKSCPNQEVKDEALKLITHLKLQKFASASMWIMKETLGLEEKYLLCEPDEGAGRFLLDEIMQAGNFGKYDERLKDGRYKTLRVGLMFAWMKHNFRLIKFYPEDVLWTPFGILRISLWRRWHYRKENELKNIK